MRGTLMPSPRTTVRVGVAVLAAAAGLSLAAAPASAAPQTLPDGPKLAKQLVKNVGITGINRHLIALQRFADRNGHTRAAGTEGHVQSAEYVATKVEDAGFIVPREECPILSDQTDTQTLTVDGAAVPVLRMTYSSDTPAGGATGPLVVVPVDATPGCEASDYDGLAPQGAIVLVHRGSCTFGQKAVGARRGG